MPRDVTAAVEVRRPRSDAEREAALALRRAVFCDEQGVSPTEEFDGRDAEALHLAAFTGDRLVGTCRLLFARDRARFGRLAVARDARRRGAGAALLAAAEIEARAAGAALIVLHAQTRTRSLYDRVGYVARGDEFSEAGIAHITMEKSLA